MKIAVAKSILENILVHVQPFLEKKDTSQITSHILIEARNNLLSVKATDYEIGLNVTITDVEVQEVGNVTANGKKLLDIVRILKDQHIVIETHHDILHITQNSSKFKLPTFASNEFPPFPSFEGEANITIGAQTLISSLKKITPATDSNNPKFELNGSLIDIKSEKINFVATDTRRLAVVEVENDSARELAIIVPKKAVVEIQKLFFDDIEILYNETHLIVKSAHYNFFTKLINGKFPDYTRIIPKECKYSIELPKNEFIMAMKQIRTTSNDMKITFLPQTIVFESLSDENIEAKTEIALANDIPEEFTLAANSTYILDFLAQIQSQNFNIDLNEQNLPFVLREGNFKTIVMPIVI